MEEFESELVFGMYSTFHAGFLVPNSKLLTST